MVRISQMPMGLVFSLGEEDLARIEAYRAEYGARA